MIEHFDRIAGALRCLRFAWASEAEFQSGVELAFQAGSVAVSREYSLGAAGRADFFLLAGVNRGIAIELKVKGSPAAVLRQLHRYAEVDAVLGVVLVTASMRLAIPDELAGKPGRTIFLSRVM